MARHSDDDASTHSEKFAAAEGAVRIELYPHSHAAPNVIAGCNGSRSLARNAPDSGAHPFNRATAPHRSVDGSNFHRSADCELLRMLLLEKGIHPDPFGIEYLHNSFMGGHLRSIFCRNS